MIGILGNAEGRAILEDAAAGDDAELADGEQIAVDLEVDDAPGMRAHAVDAAAHQLLDIAVELLEMLRPKEHSLGPDDLVIPMHDLSQARRDSSPDPRDPA
jgi:hypothetical protein